jgi:hypothetical protein
MMQVAGREQKTSTLIHLRLATTTVRAQWSLKTSDARDGGFGRGQEHMNERL